MLIIYKNIQASVDKVADAFGNNTVRFFSGRMRKKFRKDEIIGLETG